ncbi:MAG TPA: MarR family winged helix-turn-helix transcriptional regulator [Solirubrobacterales bacterium]|nr:MarR family winged helix-turn-helix transcriptional regulator [Solirubrobacterales bacterium]
MTADRIDGDRAPSTLAFLLSQVGIHASKRFAERIAEVDLNPPLFRVLNLVDAAEGKSQQAIGAAIEVPASRMVALVDELEQRGLVERRPDPADRRVRALYLTGKGRQTLARGREIARKHEEELTRGLAAADRRRLVDLLQKMVDQQAIGKGVHPGLSGTAGPPPVG